MTTPRTTKPELMSPAGHWPQLHAAVECGADAVYFGLKHFSARAKVGFSTEELPRVMQTLHRRSVKGFVAFNTLVFDHELRQAEKAIIEIANSGADAIIVQDIGIAHLARQIAPELEIHGSTQMSITSAQGAELAKHLGCHRVVLGRELSLAGIRKIASNTEVELEVFVHGALCVSYSGQCFSSEAWGGRSANRGKCAQACRLSYDLMVDGEEKELGPYRYLLSPGDLYAIHQVPDLVDIGIDCLKIEGRYKDAEYVALATRAYREAIDLACLEVPNEISNQEHLELEQIYSRGLGPHFISGTNHQNVVVGRAPRHRGIQVGQVIGIRNGKVTVDELQSIKRGDGIVFDSAAWRSPDEPEEGGHVYEVSKSEDGGVHLEFGRGEVDFSRIKVGDLVWRTHDPRLSKKLKPLLKSQTPVYTRPIRFQVSAKIGHPLSIQARLDSGLKASYLGTSPLIEAEKRPLNEVTLEEKLGRLGGSPFHLESLELLALESVFVPTSELNQARRELVENLLGQLVKTEHCVTHESISLQLKTLADQKSDASKMESEKISMHVLVRTPEQLNAAIDAAEQIPIASITLDYLELYGLRPSVEQIRAAKIRPRVASPRILKPAEQNVIRFLQSLKCDILIRSGGLLNDLKRTGPEKPKNATDDLLLIGDFSLNAANAISCHLLMELGLDRITPTYDLNGQQITELTKLVPCSSLEVIAYSHLPVFHTEHCVFCRFLSAGTDNTNCGHPCEKHRVAVRDQQGRSHPIMADVGCRNTIFGAQAQVDPERISNWINAGLTNFRLEFVHQNEEQVKHIVAAFGSYFDGVFSSQELSHELSRHSPQETTQGSLFVPGDFKQLVQLS